MTPPLEADPSFLTWLVPRGRRAGLDSDMSGGAFLLSFTLVLQARLAPIHRLPIVVVWSCSRSLSLSLKLARFLSAGDLHHCIRRLSCGLLEVGLRYVLDLAASHHLGLLRHLC